MKYPQPKIDWQNPGPGMREVPSVAPTSSVQLTSFQSYQTTSAMKYGGLINPPWLRTFRNHLVQLITYVFTQVPTTPALHIVVTVFRILQLFGPAFLPYFSLVWDNTSAAYKIVCAFNFAFQFMTPQHTHNYGLYFLFGYFFLSIAFLIILFVLSSFYTKTAYLPIGFSRLIAYYLSIFGYLLTPPAFTISLYLIGEMIFTLAYSILEIITVILCAGISVLIVWINLTITSQSLTFRHNSMMSILTSPQICFTIPANCLGPALAFASTGPRILQAVVLALVGVTYGMCTFIPMIKAGFLYNWVQIIIPALSIDSCLSSFVGMILVITGKTTGTVYLFSIIFLDIVLYLIFAVVHSRSYASSLALLDEILDNRDAFSKVTSMNHLINIASAGFKVGHPICVDWTIFRMAIEKWRKDADLWLMFAKFISIYPEEIHTLAWIFKTVIDGKLRGMSARTIKQQSIVLARRRESNLSPELKEKIAALQKHVHSTKHKLARVWDVAIQGNIPEVEHSVKVFLEERRKDEMIFEHLFRQFPNNRFVTRSYGHYLSEVNADPTAAFDMFEKTRLLQKGVRISHDQTHELGLMSFPALPEFLKKSGPQLTSVDIQTDYTQSSASDGGREEDEAMKPNSQVDRLRQTIREMRIGAISFTVIYRLAVLAIMVLFVFIFFLSYMSTLTTQLIEPLNYIVEFAELRNYNGQAAALSCRYVYQQLGVYAPTVQTTNLSLNVFNNSWSTRLQLYSVLLDLTGKLQDISAFASYDSSDTNIQAASAIIFDYNFVLYNFESPSEMTIRTVALETALNDYVIQLSELTNESYNVTLATTKTGAILNPLLNCYNISSSLNDVIAYIRAYCSTVNTNISTISIAILVVFFVVQLVVYEGGLWIQMKKLRTAKEEAYKCLTLLPKNTVSALSENLHVFQKKSSDTSSSTSHENDLNKREENIIRVLNTGVATHLRMADLIILIAMNVAIHAMMAAAAYLVYYMISVISDEVLSSSEELDYTFGAYTASMRAIYFLNAMALEGTSYADSVWDRFNLTMQFELALEKASTFWNEITTDTSTAISYATNRMNCSSKYEYTSDERKALMCYRADSVYFIVRLSLYQMYTDYVDHNLTMNAESDSFSQLYDVMVFPLYDSFFSQLFDSSITSVESNISVIEDEYYPWIITLMIVSCACEVVILIQLNLIAENIKSVLELLLHCNPTVIMQIPKIMAVIGGHFEQSKAEFSNHSKDYFDSVYNSLIDAVLCTDANLKIVTCNESCTRILGFKPEDIIGSSLQTVLQSESFEGNVDPILHFTSASEQINLTHSDGTKTNLQFSSVAHDQQYIFTIRDITSSVRYQQLLVEERAKSDKLLASIIPKKLVQRVQSGEKHISFSIQSASIVFIDIVEFTPWCSSLPANKVMQTLNRIFGSFDLLLLKYPTMTRIKGIGDCYMAAGGIFSEINLPAEHTKEAVNFGLDAIDALEALNSELGEKLRIRVGINTGGPIVGGVLGIGKPTFEIFGPAINMAQQMEHTGVPMQVQISRPVYELIYGESFKIKERGTVEVKGGKVLTYLVSKT